MSWEQTVYSIKRKSLVPAPTIKSGQELIIAGSKYEVWERGKVIAEGKLVIELPLVREVIKW